jgi:hypothetical protein
MALKPGNVIQAKAASAAYTDTTAKTLFTLPANAMIMEATINGTTSNAATTGVLTLYSQEIGSSTAAAAFAVINAKTATGVTGFGVLSGISFARTSKPVRITAVYTETGTAASAGAWTVIVKFM